jgi:hypothetical protein
MISSVVWLRILLGPYWCMYGVLFGMRPNRELIEF